MDRSELQAFVAVVRAGSFTRAADTLQTQKAHLSRVVSRLEARLGVRLLQRSSRSLTATEAGRELFDRALGILAALDETEQAMAQMHGEPRGVLRLTCGVEMGLLAVHGWVADYLGRYPQVRVDADYTNRLVDVIREGFDLAIRVGPLPDSSLTARRLGEMRYALFASPGYLQEHGTPGEPADLAAHETMALSLDPARPWRLENGDETFAVTRVPRYLSTTSLALRDAAVAGVGIALLPRFQAAPLVRRGALVEILHGWQRHPVPVNALFASGRYLSPKVRSFIELALAAFAVIEREG